MDDLRDKKVRAAVLSKVRGLGRGLMGDVQPIGEGISELRIHLGAGWRLYFVQRGPVVIVLLAGGSKATQQKDIKRAKALAAAINDIEEGR